MFAHLGARDGNADPPAAIRFAQDVPDAFDSLDIDQGVGGDDIGPQLNKNVGPARQEARNTLGLRRNCGCILETFRGVVLHVIS